MTAATSLGQVGTTFAGASVQFDILASGDYLWWAYFDVNRNIVVKRRSLTTGATIARTFTVDNIYKTEWDSHGWMKLGIDGSDRLHVTGGMHRTPMLYWRSGPGGNPDTLTRHTTLIASGREDRVTYPEFINKPNGTLGWLMFRDGKSGDGDTWVYRWDNGAGQWTDAVKVFESDAPTYDGNAYPEVYATADGWYHLAYCWRDTGDASTNTRLSYVKTQDFQTFVDVAGQSVSRPMTVASTRPIVDQAINAGLVNGEWQWLVAGTWTMIAYGKTAPNGTKQVYLAASDAGGPWQIRQLTNDAGGAGLIGNNWPDNYLSSLGDGWFACDYRWSTILGEPGRRVWFRPSDTAVAPVSGDACPPLYPAQTWPGWESGSIVHYAADSRPFVQCVDVNRAYVNRRPVDAGTQYVLAWLGGPDLFSPDPAVDPASLPARPVHLWKVTA